MILDDIKSNPNLKQIIRLVYNSYGVITPVSFPMMLAAAIPAHPRFKKYNRHCIVISGGREPNHYQQLPGHQFLHTIGQMKCCESGGCWKSRTVQLDDKDEKNKSLCLHPIKNNMNQYVPECMMRITPEEVIQTIKRLI